MLIYFHNIICPHIAFQWKTRLLCFDFLLGEERVTFFLNGVIIMERQFGQFIYVQLPLIIVFDNYIKSNWIDLSWVKPDLIKPI